MTTTFTTPQAPAQQDFDRITEKSLQLARRADIGSDMTVRVDKKTTFTGKIKSVEFLEVRRSGYDLYGVFAVTVENKFGKERTFNLRSIPVR